MRGRTMAAFALGVATGALGLGMALWNSGALNLDRHTARAIVLPAAASLAPRTAEPLPAPVPPTMEMPPAATRGEAGRSMAAEAAGVERAPHLATPIEGLDPARIVETFGDTRQSGQHEALDIPAPRGTPVRAVAEGNVVKLFLSQRGGITVYEFDNSRQWCFYYAHLDSYAPGLKEGTLLRKGDILGYVGSTGNAPPDAPHLHLAVFRLGPEKQWWKGTAVDPLPLLR